MWAASVVAVVKRYLARSVPAVAEVATSTLRTAKCARQIIPGLVEALLAGAPQRLHAAFLRALEYLAVNARRAHPKRDQRSGRLATGL